MNKQGRAITKPMMHISAITEDWIKASYPKASKPQTWKHRSEINRFLEFLGVSDSEFLETYKRASDRVEWAKQTGQKVVAFYNKRVQEGYATNTVRAEISSVRAFSRDNAISLIVPRRKIAKVKSAKGEHEFTREELSKMFYVADVQRKSYSSDCR